MPMSSVNDFMIAVVQLMSITYRYFNVYGFISSFNKSSKLLYYQYVILLSLYLVIIVINTF